MVDISTLSFNWRAHYDRSITYIIGGNLNTAIIKSAGGKQYYFNQVGASFVADVDNIGKLNSIGVDTSGNLTGWIYINEADEIETYDATGKLTSIINKQGLTQTLTYSDGTAGPNGGYVLDATGVATSTVLPAGKLT